MSRNGEAKSSQPEPQHSPALRFLRPERGPTRVEVENARYWRVFQERGVAAVRESATKWRDGLAAFVTIITGAVVLAGSSAATNLAYPWKFWIAGLIFTGYAAALFGLWLALKAAAGVPVSVALTSYNESNQPLWEHELRRAVTDSQRLSWARRAIVVALLCFWSGALAWWLAPIASAGLPDRLTERASGNSMCGRVTQIDAANVKVRLDGGASRTIALADLASVDLGGCE